MGYLTNHIRVLYDSKNSKKAIFICSIENNSLTLRRKQKFADILKAFISACFGISKSGKFHNRPKQEGSKRPLGYVYPARRASFVGLLCLVAFHIRRGRSLLILAKRVYQNLDMENKQR